MVPMTSSTRLTTLPSSSSSASDAPPPSHLSSSSSSSSSRSRTAGCFFLLAIAGPALLPASSSSSSSCFFPGALALQPLSLTERRLSAPPSFEIRRLGRVSQQQQQWGRWQQQQQQQQQQRQQQRLSPLFAAEGDADTEAAAAAEAAIARRFEQMAAAQAAEKAKQEANQELRESIWAAKRIENAVLDEPSAADREKAAMAYQDERNALVGDALFLGALGTCLAWFIGPSISTPLSYGLGAIIGTAYVVLLGQYAASFDTDGGGASQGRFALVFFLVLVAGKNKAVLDILPLLGGFFTYQVAALAQGFKAIAAANEE